MLHEERKLDLPLVELRGVLTEIHGTERPPVVARPLAVIPRPHHQAVVGARARPLDRAIGLERPEQVLGVVPAPDHERRRRRVAQVRPDVAGPPERVIGVVLERLGPERHIAFQQLTIDVGERRIAQEERVAVRCRYRDALRQRGAGRRPRPTVVGDPAERVHQEERAVVPEIVADEPVADGSLRRDCLDRRVRVDRPHRCIEAGVRDAPHADAAVVPGDVIEQPLDGVVGVRGLVHRVPALLDRHRPHLDELPLGHELSAHVLVDEDEALVLEALRRSEARGVGRGAVRRHAVRRPKQQDWIGLRGVARRVNGREQRDAVAHGHTMLGLRIPAFDARRTRGRLRGSRGDHRRPVVGDEEGQRGGR